jgi:hypothetical protein
LRESLNNVAMSKHCTICGKLLGQSYLVDYWGTEFCPDHLNQYPHCCYCDRLVPIPTLDVTKIGCRFVRCDVCIANAINHIQQARPIFSRLIQWVNNHGLLYNNLNLRIEFRNRSELDQLIRKPDNNASLGATLQRTVTQGGQNIKSEVEGVAILRGLPGALFQGVTIHELGHAWLIVHNIINLPSWVEEGFCELLSYHYYIELSNHESKYYSMGIEKNLHPDYGGGFRRLRALEAEFGLINLIQFLQNNHQLPIKQ